MRLDYSSEMVTQVDPGNFKEDIEWFMTFMFKMKR